ncbi:MAG: hypothetical protein HN352_07865 [Bacteroidetes bacterium]|jgi:hypothetical protein|nr:hypothetical protein [Bacteroidota bacterium]MBT3747459.1 hypothetical protein [Bacteroidota bacterium]MBT4398819.1 hypothetical protein [Bacteroidota bacterium]MBT4411983.1 hypothetical protein [Bacteroidota bacterium]MBT5428148.1 hypothetical protein [Bacteroidota bacterium]
MKRIVLFLFVIAMVIPSMAQTRELTEADKRKRYMAVEMELKKAVEQGQITKNQAEERLIELRKRMFERQDKASGDRIQWAEYYMKGAEAALIAAAKAGDLDRSKIEPILLDIRKGVAQRLGAERSRAEDNQNPEARMREYLAKVHKEVEMAVKAGKMTRKEGEKKIKEAEKAIEQRREKMTEGAKERKGR